MLSTEIPREPIASDDEIRALVREFYGRVRLDPVLGPIFNSHVEDWDRHFLRLDDFWSSVLNTSGRYKGQPMLVHMRMQDLRVEHFGHWLGLFREAAPLALNERAVPIAIAAAENIAVSMKLGLRQLRGEPLPPPRA